MVKYRAVKRSGERAKPPEYQIEISGGKHYVTKDERSFDCCPYCESEDLFYDPRLEVYVCGGCGKVWG